MHSHRAAAEILAVKSLFRLLDRQRTACQINVQYLSVITVWHGILRINKFF